MVEKIKTQGKPNLVIFSSTVAYDVEKLYSVMKEELGDIPFQGGTSVGCYVSAGYISEDNRALGAVVFFDDDSDFGVEKAKIKAGDPKAAAKST